MLADNVLELLKEEIPLSEYNNYIKQLSFEEELSKSDLKVFSVPNVLIVRWIKTKYSKLLAHHFETSTGKKPEIKIITKQNIKNRASIKSKNESKIAKKSMLISTYNFENFIVGSSNEVAYSVAKSVSKKPGLEYNPFFIYSPTGLGKTHLMLAIGNKVQQNGKIVIYTTSEQFMNDYTYNLKNKTMDRFRDKYRSCDVLLIDDVQFFKDKVQTQEEFFHTFNELHQKNKQIILTSDKPPKMINGLEERLQSRFEWGFTTDIASPQLETKIAIINKKCEINKVDLNPEVINYIASHMGDNIREIEGAITNINAHASFMRQEITLEFAKNVIKEQIKQERENISLEKIINTISKTLNIKPSDIKSKKRHARIVEARRIGIFLARNLTPNSTPELAKFFGMKDHTAISHNIKKINELIDLDEHFKLRIQEIKNKILTKEEI